MAEDKASGNGIGAYEDGFNVGEIVTWDAGWSMILPHFGRITRRTPAMIVVKELCQHRDSDRYGQTGTCVPIDTGTGRIYRARLGKYGFKVDGHYAHVWGGEPLTFDFMD